LTVENVEIILGGGGVVYRGRISVILWWWQWLVSMALLQQAVGQVNISRNTTLKLFYNAAMKME